MSLILFLVVECAVVPNSDTGFALLAVPFKLLGAGLALAVVLGLANLGYCLGPLLERVTRPVDAARFRARWYRAGSWLSVAVPIIVPIVVGGLALLYPEYWE